MTNTQHQPMPNPAGPRAAMDPSEVRRMLDAHITEAHRAGLSSEQVSRSLLATGWHPGDVALAMTRHDQPPNGTFGYAWLFFGVGFAGLSLAGAFHVILDGLKDQGSRSALVGWLTILVCSAPFAAAAMYWAANAERRDPNLRRSPVRKGLGMTLLWISGVVGMARLIEFVARFFSAVLDPAANPGANPTVALTQVLVTLSVAGGLFWWTWDFVRDTGDA